MKTVRLSLPNKGVFRGACRLLQELTFAVLLPLVLGILPAAAHLLRSWVRIPPGHGYLSVVSVVCCQVEVSATS